MVGAVLAALALGGITYGLIEWGHPFAVVGAASAASSWPCCSSTPSAAAGSPMMPLGLFRDRTFSAANAMTLLVYAALGAVLFFLVLQLQTVGGYGALEAGLATLPLTVVHGLRRLPRRRPRPADRPAHPDDRGPDRDGRRRPCCS